MPIISGLEVRQVGLTKDLNPSGSIFPWPAAHNCAEL